MAYDNQTNWDMAVFIRDPSQLDESIQIRELGKHAIFLKYRVFCSDCNGEVGRKVEGHHKRFLSKQKAQDACDKHINTKKYAGHDVKVEEIRFDMEPVTISDISGTTPNTEKLESLRERESESIKTQIKEIEQKFARTLQNISTIFGVKYTGCLIPRIPHSISDGSFTFESHEQYLYFSIDAHNLEAVDQLINDTYEKKENESPYERMKTIWYLFLHGHGSSLERKFYWDIELDLSPCMGFNNPIGDCDFCGKVIDSWNDVRESDNHSMKVVHKGCYRHQVEARSLQRYCEKLMEATA